MTETKQKAIEKAKENFIDDLHRICDWIQHECNDLRDEEFEDEYDFLLRKALVLADFIRLLPLDSDHCPFCIENDITNSNGELVTTCRKCEYADTHDACRSETSIYMVLMNALKLVWQVLIKLYAVEKPKREDLSSIRILVEKIHDQLTYWRYRDLLTKKGKD